MDQRSVDQAYLTGQANWDVGHAQPAFIDLTRRKLLRSPVLDVGCGTGENVLQLASLGYEAWGIDISPLAIQKARQKAQERGLPAWFILGDALTGPAPGRVNTIIDSGFFHGLSDADRERYAIRMSTLLRPGDLLHLLCVSDRDAGEEGVRGVSVADIANTFHERFAIKAIVPSALVVRPESGVRAHHAWLATLRRRRRRLTRAPRWQSIPVV